MPRRDTLQRAVAITPSPPQTATRKPSPLTGGEWLAARASLARRRMGRIARRWSLILVPLVAVAIIIPLASGDRGGALRRETERLAADTLRTAQLVRVAKRASVAAESRFAAADPAPGARATAVPASPAPTAEPNAVSLGSAIGEARRLRTPTAWLAVANEPLVRGGPRMTQLADSLARLSRRRDTLPAGPARDQQAAPLTAAISAVGYTILSIAEARYTSVSGASPQTGMTDDVSVERAEVAADTVLLAARLTAARDSLASARRVHDSALTAVQVFYAAKPAERTSRLASMTPALLLLVIYALGLAVAFAVTLNREINAPTLAHALEAERAIGVTVLATVRDAPVDGPARFRPSGVDPFRMLYLGLTATGTRSRTMIVTGSDSEIVAAVGARLAISAAADHRTTLVVDVDPADIAVARIFRERAEPGLTDALAGSFTWREIARPIGSSDGLPITLMPAGTERDDLPQGEQLVLKRDEFAKFRGAFDLAILVAPAAFLDLAIGLVESSPVVLCAVVGTTPVDGFIAQGASLREKERRLHGTVLWDAPRPEVVTRAQLAGMLSKRKDRTPGGSFAAVKKAIEKDSRRQ